MMSDRRSHGSGHRRSGHAASRATGSGSNNNRPPTSSTTASVRERRSIYDKYEQGPSPSGSQQDTASRRAHSGGGSGAGGHSQQDDALYFLPGSVVNSSKSSSRHQTSLEQHQGQAGPSSMQHQQSVLPSQRSWEGNYQRTIGVSGAYAMQEGGDQPPIVYDETSKSAQRKNSKNPFKKVYIKSKEKIEQKLRRKK
ncbi:hypothetical protein J7T55_009836 [Diaporthe amygdali]|uniref:uncharacterized protein n=1 Tax=Phomopsis amygdali TaxID=1214568 RepID=UPI0022FE5717|nr:uncharacterized protein J7T55_009836 [Diaporthe amygdali]KAJ0116686.1 hypothetical protein J7T55_009836 [Diaporthe amygdali]